MNIVVTKIETVTDENGTYCQPVVEDGKTVFVEPTDDDYYESMSKILNSGIVSLVRTEDRINNVYIAMKNKNPSGRGFSESTARLFFESTDYIRYIFFEIIPQQHTLFHLSPGSIIIYDSNLNYNVYDVYSGEFELKESGCINPDIMMDNDDTYGKHIELEWYLNNTNSGFGFLGYLEMFDSTQNITIDGEEYEYSNVNYSVEDDIPNIENYYTLSQYLGIKCSRKDQNGVLRFYKLVDFPSGDDFYRILEMKNGSKKAKIITHNSVEEIELTFAPYPKEDKPISLYIYPLLDILDALQIRYHYPRCDGSILISMSKGY